MVALPALHAKYDRDHNAALLLRRGKQSSDHCMSVKAGDHWIKMSKLDPIKAKIHRPMDGKLKSITLSRTVTGKHYASLLYDTHQVAPESLKDIDAGKVIGLDMGISHLAIDSTGRKGANPRFIKQARENLKRKQQALSRKSKGSAKRANARNDFQHNLSRRLIDDNQTVIVEMLKVKNMMKNTKLAKPIGDASWMP